MQCVKDFKQINVVIQSFQVLFIGKVFQKHRNTAKVNKMFAKMVFFPLNNHTLMLFAVIK